MENKILIFIPVYNCEKQITRVLAQINEDVLKFVSKIIVVNNRSTDNTVNNALEYIKNNNLPAVVLTNKENYGLGGSHKVAFNYAIENGFDYIITLHGDDQGDISYLLPFLQSGEYEKYDRLVGARFMRGSKLRGYSKFRTFGNYVYDFLFTLATGTKVYDLGSGLNIFNVGVLKSKYFMKFNDGLIFDYFLIMSSAYLKHKVKFFPILWREDDQVSNVKLMNQAMVTLKLLLNFVLNKKKFIESEHRTNIVENYTAEIA